MGNCHLRYVSKPLLFVKHACIMKLCGESDVRSEIIVVAVVNFNGFLDKFHEYFWAWMVKLKIFELSLRTILYSVTH